MSANYLQSAMYMEWSSLIIESDSRQIPKVIDIFSTSAKLCIYVPKFYWRFKYYILHIARPYFPVAWFSVCRKCLSHSIWTTLYLGLHLRFHLPCCLFLKYTLSPILKDVGYLSMVFCAVLKRFSSKVFLAMVRASL